jgi:alpha-mannosidase
VPAAPAQPAAAISVFNALSWERTALVALPACLAGACDLEGRLLPQQRIGSTTFVEARVPSCGWTALRASATATGTNAPCRGATDAHVGAASSAPTDHAPTECAVLENEHLRVTFNERGEITSLYDKDAALEVSDGVCNDLRMYKDTPGYWDAWDVDSLYPLTPVPLDEPAAVELLCAGPLVAQLRISRKLHDSHMTQTVSLRRGSRRVDLHTVIDWRERHKLLKVNFPVRIHANEGVHEIQFGHLRRPTHQSRPFDADRYEVSNHKWSALMEENRGVAVLNDCKYGVNIDGNSINLTLLKSAKAPDWNADQGHQEFTYAFYVWNGSFADCDLVREGYDLNAPVTTVEGDAGSRSLFSLDAPNIILDTVKAAEDGSGDVILRLYESKRMATRCTLTTTLKVGSVHETDMLEQGCGEHGGRELSSGTGSVALEFRPFEIKTLRMTLA